ncbi:MAG TPA: class I SAM-dependent methyltransferase, partial [Bryobacteraceae bacterium]|nr:class I SAM-dependent methyltransferase [Bryobacteraceae bacterium]
FTGYDISPQALALSERFSTTRCRFLLGDAFADRSTYDLVLVMDVVEHVEDCFRFLRQARQKGRLKLYHIPLEAHASAVLRRVNLWNSAGHIHLFTIETAIKSLEHTDHRIVDWVLTDGALGTPNKPLRTRVANLLRYPLAKVDAGLAARLLGGYSILILAE